jgi:serine phosphatase RsbU (regulator of sigma subunit)
VDATRGSLTPRLRRARLRRPTVQVLGVVALGAAVVGLGVGLLLVGIVNLRSSASATHRTSTLLGEVIGVEESVVDAETGLRGYVITTASEFLAPLRTATREISAETSALVQTAERQHDRVAGARSLGAAARSYITVYAPLVLALMRSDRAAARSLALTLAGKDRVDAIRSQTARLEHALSAQEASRDHAANSTASQDITFGVIVLVVLVALTAAIEGAFGRLLLTRNRALRRTRETARMLQTSLLPLAIPQIPGCDVVIRFTPAGHGELVGGDFYDVFQLEGSNRWAVVVGDVCGKGAEAAATTAVARWTLRSASLLGLEPAQALAHLNTVMLRRRQRLLFATITYLLLEIGAEEVRVTVACAGHPAPILLTAGAEPVAVAAHGDLVGIFPQLRLETTELSLYPGDLIVAYTDGATDFSPASTDPLERFLRDADPGDAEAVATAIERRALGAGAAPRDDIAIVAIGFNGNTDADEVGPLGEGEPPLRGSSPPAAAGPGTT